MDAKALVDAQRAYFKQGKTLPLKARRAALTRLEQGILEMQEEIYAALKTDLNKSPFEAYMAEVGLTLSELRFVRRHLRGWMRRRHVPTPLNQFPAASFTLAEPYGIVLILAPWNYPFMLCMEPLIGAIAAGNCCVLKPSPFSKATSAVMKRLITRVFPPEQVALVEGDLNETQSVMQQRYDYIFFTGSPTVGKLVMEAAAKNLTPVSLELGGKSPCIIDETANISLAAKRLVFGKYLNAGQTCVAPDYVLVQEQVEEQLVTELRRQITAMFGKHPLDDPDYPKIITEKHFQRILGLMEGEELAAGGASRSETRQIEPTVLRHVRPDAPVMRQEIFGPLLPLICYRSFDEAEAIVLSQPKPLALYLFSENRKTQNYVLERIPFGGGCINDTIVHLATSHMGFGGVGASGMGAYHGKLSFETFSHRKSIVRKANWLDMPIRYPPYTAAKERLLHRFLR